MRTEAEGQRWGLERKKGRKKRKGERRVKQAHRSGVERKRGQKNRNHKVIKPSLVNTHSFTQ